MNDQLRREVKKRVYLASRRDEFCCSSAPLTEYATKYCLSVSPGKEGRLKKKFAAHVTEQGYVSPCALMLGLFYIRRLTEINPSFVKTFPSKHLFISSLMAASKYLNDDGETEALVNSDWADIGKLPRSKIDDLETQFLSAIDWKLFVSMDEFYTFVTSVEGRLALNQAQVRGWLSYSDMVTIWEWMNVSNTMMSAASDTACTIATSSAVYLMCLTAIFAAACSLNPAAETTSETSLSSDFSPVDFAVYHSTHLAAVTSDLPVTELPDLVRLYNREDITPSHRKTKRREPPEVKLSAMEPLPTSEGRLMSTQDLNMLMTNKHFDYSMQKLDDTRTLNVLVQTPIETSGPYHEYWQDFRDGWSDPYGDDAKIPTGEDSYEMDVKTVKEKPTVAERTALETLVMQETLKLFLESVIIHRHVDISVEQRKLLPVNLLNTTSQFHVY